LAGSGNRWLKHGCLGCLGVSAAAVLVICAVAGFAYMGAQSEQVVQRVVAEDVPVPLGVSTEPATDAKTFVEPAAPGESFRVEGRYDEETYQIEELFDPGLGDVWSYRVEAGRKRTAFLGTLREAFGGTPPEVHIYLPQDVPMRLDLRAESGDAEVELGGLWLTSATIASDKCGVTLSFRDPLAAPIETLATHTSKSGFTGLAFGNASPRSLIIDHNMGGMDLDLRGLWLVDSEISISTSLSAGTVQLPRDVVIEGVQGRELSPDERRELKPATLRFTVSGGMGELQFVP